MRILALTAMAVFAIGSSACGSDGAADGQAGRGPVTKTIEAGDVTVEIDPQRIDADGASFSLTLDTHSVELDMDIADGASLVVDGDTWTDARWDGDGPSGHHREGILRFDAAGEPDGTMRLELDGFPEPVEAVWQL